MGRKRRSRTIEDVSDLNLSSMMDIIMLLIPTLVLSSVFVNAGVINVSSPRNANSPNPENEQQEERPQIPKVVVYISADGFRVGNMNPQLPAGSFDQYALPIDGCSGGGENAGTAATDPNDLATRDATVCLLPNTEGQPLVERLDMASLYNQLVKVRMNPAWFDEFSKENNSVVSIVGDPDVPFEALISVMDVARYFLNPGSDALDEPSGSADITKYLIGNGSRPTLEQFRRANYLGRVGSRVDLFPNPVLLLPRSQG